MVTAPASSPRGRRKPVWREVEEREARRRRGRASARRRPLTVVYDIDGPRVRLGIAWFVVAMAGLAIGTIGATVVYGTAAAVAAAQTARAWRRSRRGGRPIEPVAAAVAAALAVGAAVSTAMLGLVLLGAVAVCLVVGGSGAGVRTFQCGVWPGAAAAGMVVSHRFEPWAAIALVLIASAYEIGDYIVGSGARNVLEGPIAGATAALVVGSSAGIVAFGVPDCVVLAAVGAALCPLGQLAASLVLPSNKAPASGLRRLDSLLLLGPAWALLSGLAVQQTG